MRENERLAAEELGTGERAAAGAESAAEGGGMSVEAFLRLLCPHFDCTCCRHWRLVQLPSAIDIQLAEEKRKREGRPKPPPAQLPLGKIE